MQTAGIGNVLVECAYTNSETIPPSHVSIAGRMRRRCTGRSVNLVLRDEFKGRMLQNSYSINEKSNALPSGASQHDLGSASRNRIQIRDSMTRSWHMLHAFAFHRASCIPAEPPRSSMHICGQIVLAGIMPLDARLRD
jgi:hypothetical protein